MKTTLSLVNFALISQNSILYHPLVWYGLKMYQTRN